MASLSAIEIAFALINVVAVNKAKTLNATVIFWRIRTFLVRYFMPRNQDSTAPVRTGDSVILGIRYELGDQRSIGLINARVGRQVPELLEVLKRDKLSVGDSPIIFNLGNNNALTRTQVAEVFAEVASQSQIVVVNTAVPRPWRDSNNALIAELAAQNTKVRIVDWATISNGHPEYFAPDGVHLQPAGIRVYVAAILEALKK